MVKIRTWRTSKLKSTRLVKLKSVRLVFFTFYEAEGEWVISRKWNNVANVDNMIGGTTVIAVLKHSNRIEAEAVCSGLDAAYRFGRVSKAREIQRALSGE